MKKPLTIFLGCLAVSSFVLWLSTSVGLVTAGGCGGGSGGGCGDSETNFTNTGMTVTTFAEGVDSFDDAANVTEVDDDTVNVNCRGCNTDSGVSINIACNGANETRIAVQCVDGTITSILGSSVPEGCYTGTVTCDSDGDMVLTCEESIFD